jgi:hypothetical protein
MWPKRDADYSPLSIAEVKYAWSFIITPAFLHYDVKMTVFWCVAPCSLVEIYRRLEMLHASITEDSHLHTRRRENLKSHTIMCFTQRQLSYL